jgi:hypothetical protein
MRLSPRKILWLVGKGHNKEQADGAKLLLKKGNK